MGISIVLYSVLYILIGRIALNLNDGSTAIIFLIAALVPLVLLMKWQVDVKLILLVMFLFILGKIYYFLVLDPIVGPDAVRYYQQVFDYRNNFDYFLNFFWEEFKDKHLLSSAYPSFGIVYLPFYNLFNTTNLYLLIIFNSLSLIFIAYISLLTVKKHFNYNVKNKKLFYFLVATGILISPAFMYWSSTFSKDIFSLLIVVIALYFLLGKRYFLFLLFIAYATMLRPYSIIIVLIYYAVFKKSTKIMIVGVLGSLATVFYLIGITGVINSIYSFAYLLLAPNPFSLENWGTFFLIEIEVLLIASSFLLSLYVFIKNKSSRKFYLLVFMGLIIYSCVMTLVGNEAVSNQGGEYGFGVVGDNITRKKLPMIVMFYIITAYTFTNLFRKKATFVKSV